MIIDEISMVSNNTFTRLDRILKAVHHNGKPFGGIVLILVSLPDSTAYIGLVPGETR